MAADADAASLRKDVESMQATIKHLQNAVDAKSTTIGILSKASREGGDLETHITNAVQTKYAAIIKAKDDEIMMLANKAAKASEARPSVAMQEVREALQKSLNEYRDRCKVLEKDKKELTKTLAEQKEQLANVGKDAQNLEAMRGMVATLEEERDCLKRTQQELLESLQQERAELERAQSGAGGGGGADQEAIARLEGDLAEAWKKVEETKLRADAAELRASQAASASAGAAVAERRVEEEKKKASEMASQMRDYQMKAFELKSENDALAQQLEALQEEMTQELEEKSRELEETQKELSVLQADRDGHLRIAKEQIDSRLQEVRQNTQAELQSQLAEQAKERQEEQRQLKELSDEVDKLRLTRDAQLAELKALRQAVGDTDSRDQALSQEKLAEIQAAPEEVKEAKREKARSLRELSKFAFDEMSERMAEQRRELEGEKRKLQSEFEQKVSERSARIVELSNSNDSLQTQVETLERARDALTQQRDELAREVRDTARRASDAEANAEAMSEANAEAEKELRALRDHLGCSRLVYALHRGVVAPAFQILTCSLRPEAPAEEAGSSPREKLDRDADIDASTMDGTVIEDGDEDEEEDDDDEDEENTYGLDQSGQENWAEMIEANTLDALFAGAFASTENLSQASEDLQEHVHNIVFSLDMFPQIYADTLSVLDRTGKGKELRNYITNMQRAMARLQRICEAVSELCAREEDVREKLQNCVRVKGLEWNLRSLRTAGQHEVLLRLQRNQLRKIRMNFEDVLDQFGEKCDQNSQLDDRAKEFEKQARELEARVKELEKQKEELQTQAAAPIQADAPKSMADIQQKMENIERETLEKAAPPAPKPKGKGKGPPLPGAKAAAEAPAEAPPAVAPPADAAPAEAEAPKAKGPPKGPGKGKKGPPLPGQGPPPAPPAPAEGAPEPAPPEEAAAPKPAAKGKGKAKGPPLPGAKAAAEAAAAAEPPAAEPPAEPATAETPAAAPAKGPGKGKKGPPLPGAKAAAAAAEPAAAPAAPSGKGPPPPGGKGPPPPGGKGPPPPGGKGPPPPGGKGPAPPAAPGGKGPAAPAAPGGKGPAAGPAAKAGKGKGGKNALPPVDPGPEPPKDLAPKAFQWAGIQGNRFATSIFAKLLEDKATSDGDAMTATKSLKRVKLNLNALEVNFFTKKKVDTAKEAKPSAKKKTVATCLDSKRSQAVEIFLNGAGVKLDQVKACLVELDEKAVAIENLQRILEFYPNAEEVPLLKEFQQENDPAVLPWGRGEEFMISLMSISDFKVRGECCQARGQFGEEFSGIAQDVSSVMECLSSLVNSTALPAIFGMVMQIGNYLNFGTSRGASRGFSLDSLQVMARVEGFNDKTYTLMRFLMDSLEGDRAVRDGALDDMKLCDASSKIDVDDAVARLGKLEGAINQVVKYVKPVEGDPKVKDDNFNSKMSDFATQAQEKIAGLKEQVTQVADLTKQCCDMFAEKPKTPSGEFLAKFALFRKHMEEARRENLLAKAKKEKAEKKRAEKENQPKKDSNKTEEAAKAKPKAAPAPAQMRQMKVKNPEFHNKAGVGGKHQARIHGKESSTGLMVRNVDSNGDEDRPARATLDRREAKSLVGGEKARAALLANMGGHMGDAKDGPRPSLQVSVNGRITVGLTGLAKCAGGKEARIAAIEAAMKQQQQEMLRQGASSAGKGPA